MTSDEIKAKPAIDWGQLSWLREIAYQLALLNEKNQPFSPEDFERDIVNKSKKRLKQ